MHQFTPVASVTKTIADTWQKVTAVAGSRRTFIRIANEDAANGVRLQLVPSGGTAASGATAGFPLGAGAVYSETDAVSVSDVYAYSASGADITVTEGTL